MFCLSRRANVVESFRYDKCFFQNFHALTGLEVFATRAWRVILPFSGLAAGGAGQYGCRSAGVYAGVYIEGEGHFPDSLVSLSVLPARWGWVTSAPLQYKELRHE